MTLCRVALVTIASCGLIRPACAQPPVAYRVVDIGTLDGNQVSGLAMNNHGDVAGTALLSDGTLHAFRWTAEGGIEDLGANGGIRSDALGINDNATVVGLWVDQQNVAHGFIARRGEPMQDLGLVDGRPTMSVSAITNDGRIAGTVWPGLAFKTRSDGSLQFVGDVWTHAASMNDAGDVAGGWTFSSGDIVTNHAFRSFHDQFEDLGTLGGDLSNVWASESMNASGVVVGWSLIAPGNSPLRAFRSRPGASMENLGILPGAPDWGASIAQGINEEGVIVGSSTTSSWLTSAFRFTDAEGISDLMPRLPIAARAKVVSSSAFAVNESGQIGIEYGEYGTGSGLRTWVATPIEGTPVPTITELRADPAVLTPPDGRMTLVTIYPDVSDEYDWEPTCQVTAVVNDEGPATGPDPDVAINSHLSVLLRATRAGSGNGRTYTLTIACSNDLGGTSTGFVVVRVPHDSASK